ncbi:MAG: SHOCT domain-containing protein [Chloroflexi bacterium]|nr:SHOCT domain-containing protein [Chloroflexota bacterium]
MWYWHEGIRWWLILAWVLRVVFWGAIVGLIAWLVVAVTRHSASSDGKDNPLAIVKQRYAKGEINREEFEQIKRDLS